MTLHEHSAGNVNTPDCSLKARLYRPKCLLRDYPSWFFGIICLLNDSTTGSTNALTHLREDETRTLLFRVESLRPCLFYVKYKWAFRLIFICRPQRYVMLSMCTQGENPTYMMLRTQLLTSITSWWINYSCWKSLLIYFLWFDVNKMHQ